MYNSKVKITKLFHRIFAFTTLLISTGGLTQLNSSVTQLLWFLVYTILFILFFTSFKRYLIQIKKIKLYSFIILTCLISTLWSEAKLDTFEGNVKLIGTFLFSIYLFLEFENKSIFKILYNVFFVSIVLSFIFGLFLKDYGIMTGFHEGDWKGIFAQKNNLGKIMCLAAMFYYINLIKSSKLKIINFILFSLSLILIILSGSITSLIIAILIIVIPMLLKFLNAKTFLLIPSALGLIFTVSITLIIGIYNYENIVLSFGRNPELTGRTELWELSVQMLREKLMLGYGYSGFWTGYEGASANIWFITGWEPPHAHNGFIDVGLQIGLIGMLFFVICIIYSSFQAIVQNRISNDIYSIYCVLFLFFYLLINLTETNFLRENNILTILFVNILLSLENKKKGEELVENSNMYNNMQTSERIKKIVI